jgi:hypothetical protein
MFGFGFLIFEVLNSAGIPACLDSVVGGFG